MKIAIGTYHHETHSFSKDITDLESMKNCMFDDKNHLIERHRGSRGSYGSLGGYIDYAELHGWEIVPLFAAAALPAGPITKSAYEYVKNQMLINLKGQDVDGVLLHLHGASVVTDVEDAEGELIKSIKELIGQDKPVMTIFDLHANVSSFAVNEADAIFGYNTYPHDDIYEREQEVCRLFENVVTGKVKPTMYRAQPPILFPATLTETDAGPMKKIMDMAYEWEKQSGVINVSPFAGFYGSDKKQAGPSCVVITDNDLHLAEKIAKEIVDYIWEIKEEFFFEMTPIDKAIKTAEENDGLWAFIDECDDPLGGGTADGTFLLDSVLKSNIKSGAVSTIKDPEIVEKACEVGLGGKVKGKLGGKTDNLHGEPIDINAEVVLLTNKKIPWAYFDLNTLQDLGRIAVLNQNGILIVVTELKAATENINIFKYLGIDVSDLKIIILKGFGKAYRDVFKDIPVGYITPEGIGITNPDVSKIGNFKTIRRPIYPMDKDTKLRYE